MKTLQTSEVDELNQSKGISVSVEMSLEQKQKNDQKTAATKQQSALARQHQTQREYYLARKYYLAEGDPLKTNQLNTKELYISHTEESLAIEAAIAIVINGIHYAVLMASPCDLEYLALGFLYSEGLIQHSHELLDWEVTPLNVETNLQHFSHSKFDESMTLQQLERQLQDYDAYIIELTLSQRRHQQIQAQRRQLSGRTGCGMCGMTGLTQALPDLGSYKQPVASKPKLDTLLAIRQQITEAQQTHQLTGAVHGAATLNQGQLQLFEDVGRHNALDKLVGWQLRNKTELDFVVMTSRLSIELVQKAIRCQIPWLVGMSAPTSTAVRVAQRYGLGLAGFLRENRVTFYSK